MLALSVMTAHMGRPILGFHQLGGQEAVQCFYMISGFYMALILNESTTARLRRFFEAAVSSDLSRLPVYCRVQHVGGGVISPPCLFLMLEGMV